MGERWQDAAEDVVEDVCEKRFSMGFKMNMRNVVTFSMQNSINIIYTENLLRGRRRDEAGVAKYASRKMASSGSSR